MSGVWKISLHTGKQFPISLAEQLQQRAIGTKPSAEHTPAPEDQGDGNENERQEYERFEGVEPDGELQLLQPVYEDNDIGRGGLRFEHKADIDKRCREDRIPGCLKHLPAL